MNDVKLGDSHPLSADIYPVKVGGEVSSLEISQTGNGARITGDLEATGDTYASIDKMYSGLIPAYSGMIVGYTALAIEGGDASDTVGTSFSCPHSSVKLSFTVPPSGNVEIFLSVYADQIATGRTLELGLSDSPTYNSIGVAYEHLAFKGDEIDDEQIQHHWVITGLLPNNIITYHPGWKAGSAGAYIIRWGGNVTGEYAPFIMKATALPSTIYTT